ncbi:MAG: hypothetical protein ACTSR8_03650 [Promethearchaeota archaeon]
MTTKIYFWSELLSFEKLLPVIDKLANYKFGLNLAITPQKFNNVNVIVNECEKSNVELNFWPLLSQKQGYWINRWNINIQYKWFILLLENFPSINSYLLDLEDPINFRGIKGRVMNSKLNKIMPDEIVRQKLENLIDLIHDYDKKVVSTAYGGIPLGMNPRPSNADYYSYMVYTSFIKRVTNKDTRENIIFYCADKIRKEHGREKAVIDLGITYYGIINKKLMDFLGYLSLKELVSQIGICKFAKLKRVHLFSIDNMVKDIDIWLEAIDNAQEKKPPLFFTEKKGFMYRAYKKVLFSKDLSIF